MANLSLQTSFRASDDIVFRDLGGDIVILNLVSGQHLGLSPVASRIWQLMEQRLRLADILERLIQEYDAAPEELERDLMSLASDLMERGLVIPFQEPAEPQL